MKCYCFQTINKKTGKVIKLCFCPPIPIPRKDIPPKEHPDWLKIEGVKSVDINDLTVLSALSELSESLSPSLAKRLQAPIEEMLQAQLQKLPVEIKLEKHSPAEK